MQCSAVDRVKRHTCFLLQASAAINTLVGLMCDRLCCDAARSAALSRLRPGRHWSARTARYHCTRHHINAGTVLDCFHWAMRG